MIHDFPLQGKVRKFIFFIIACLTGLVVDYYLGTEVDYWVHDAAVVYQERSKWQYMGIVALDDGIPINVGRKQALPLYAKATERLIAAGAKGVFFDARVFKGMEGRMPYAVCVEENGEIRWSEPQCSFNHQGQCVVVPSTAGNAPLKMNEQAINHFSIAPYLNPQEQDFLLYDWDTVMFMPMQGVTASDRLVTKKSAIARWVDLSEDHAVYRLASFIDTDLRDKALANNKNDEICNQQRACRRIRLSKPLFSLNENPERLILPVSVLASCNEERALKMAEKLRNKAVVLQLTSPYESTDILISPMTTALFGPQLMTPGAQYIVDEVETLLNQDHPRVPNIEVKLSLFMLVALFSVLAGAYLKQYVLWLGGVAIFFILIALSFLNPIVQLWPVTAVLLTFLVSAILTTGTHLILGFKQGKLISRYMPYQIHELLMSLPHGLSFHNHRCQAVVLMSDLAGYTTVTGLLKEPRYIMNLMNDYLSETSIVLQDKYAGWLEAYVGDLVCYYWPYSDSGQSNVEKNDLGEQLEQKILKKTQAYQNVLEGALELATLQHQFFSQLSERYQGEIAHEALEKISQIINAGIGITTGTVVMGNLGPQHQGKGVLKFGILGDPLNLASRIEGLTRFFNTEIIITDELVAVALVAGFKTRYLGKMNVKGRIEPAIIYALGYAEDPRFDTELINQWEAWLTDIEASYKSSQDCPGVYCQDQKSIQLWLERGLLDKQGIWHLDQK